MAFKEKALDKFLVIDIEMTPEEDENDAKTKKIAENDGLIERVTIIEKKLITEDGRQLLVEERPITHSEQIF